MAFIDVYGEYFNLFLFSLEKYSALNFFDDETKLDRELFFFNE